MLGIYSYKDLESYDLIRSISNASNWYLILLGNLHNPTPALNLILENYQYLNRRTKDVRFFMPGFLVGEKGILTPHNKKFEFYEDGFLDTVDWLETGSEKYEYSESMEMILLPYSKSKENASVVYGFDKMLWYSLDQLLEEGGNIVKFITNGVDVVNHNTSPEKTKQLMEGFKEVRLSERLHKVFIAGSKVLEIERDSIRAIFSQLSNRGDVWFRTYTYEDFDRSFTIDGRQADYNRFIQEEANSVLFILNDRIGGITRSEFEIAINSYRNSTEPRHPNIFAYCKMIDNELFNVELQDIINIINHYGQYYTEYDDVRDLKIQVERDYTRLLLRDQNR